MSDIGITRGKLVFLLIGSTIVLSIHSPLIILSLCIFTAGISVFLKRHIHWFTRYRAIGFAAIMIILFQLLFNWSLSFEARALAGVTASARLILLSMMVFLFTETTSVSNIVGALSFLPSKICLMLTISLSLIPAIMKESTLIQIAQQSRGFTSKGLKSITGFLSVIIPLLFRTLKRAEHIAIALETKGFHI
jgi:energy-coupling factor transporter transmembrane protein EcfT